ncbi:MAG: hypothetical protein AB7P00_17670, partial [Sandaracinaceae bacterium]
CLPDSHHQVLPPPEVGDTASATIGAAGGELTLEALSLGVPAVSFDAETEISVTVIEETLPAFFTAFSPVFEFAPAGLVFDAPATIRLPFEGDPETATIFWTTEDGQTYAALDTRIEDGLAVAEVAHFSRAFVGTACTGPDCCDRGRGELDVLLMVDNSNSMAEEQASLAVQIPRMARVFATGDLDDDGVQDFPALTSIHMGSVGSDMGTAGFNVPTCANAQFGDDAILRSAGDTAMMGCAGTYTPFASLGSGPTSAEVDAFVEQVQCTAILGTGGCGFEQSLESMLKAVTPSSSPLTFFMGTSGQADGPNAGFLRPDSILATVVLTDENDCSASDGELYNMSSSVYTADPNLRCFANPSALYDPSRYIDGLRATRSNPNDVVFGLIAGIPVDLAGADPATINADPRMQEMVDPANPTRLIESCNTPGTGLAFPPRRLVDVAAGFSHATVQSICQSDFTPVVDAILQRVADRASGHCGP